MIELIFVIVIIGILVAVAIPKLFATRDDAIITKVRTDISNIRSAIVNYHTQEMMKGLDLYPDTLDDANANQENEELFNGKDDVKLLDYPIYSKNADGYWMKINDVNYTVKVMDTDVQFDYNKSNGHFDCNNVAANDTYKEKEICKKLTH